MLEALNVVLLLDEKMNNNRRRDLLHMQRSHRALSHCVLHFFSIFIEYSY